MSDSEEEESEEEVSKKPNGFSALAEDSDDEESDEEAPKARPSGFGALLEESDEEEEEESEDEPPKSLMVLEHLCLTLKTKIKIPRTTNHHPMKGK